MKRKVIIEIIIHLIFWMITIYFFINNSFLRFQSRVVSEEYFSLFLIFLTIYINYFFLTTAFFTKRKYFKYFAFLFTLIVLISSIEFLFIKDDVLNSISSASKKYQKSALQWNFFGIFFRDTLFVAFFTMFKIYRDAIKSYRLLKLNTALEKKELENQVNMVKLKVNAHFFFNSLSSIYNLALKKSDKTPEVVLNLNDLMEYVVRDSDKEWIPLDNEIEFLSNYIAIEGARFKDMKVRFDIKGDTFKQKVPPMIFETFINNSFKYTNFKREGKIDIKIECNTDGILFICKNTIDRSSDRQVNSTKKGLLNVRSRLNLVYKNNHNLEISEIDDVFIVKLLLN